MNAVEYLRDLQSKAKFPSAPAEEILEYKKNQQWEEGKDWLVKFEEADTPKAKEAFLRQQVIEPFISSLDSKTEPILKDICVGLMQTNEPNGTTLLAPEGQPLVLLHRNLVAALSRYNETQFICGKKMSEGPEEVKNYANKSFSLVLSYFKDSKDVPSSLLSAELGKEDFYHCQLKTFLQLMFITAHEFAYIYLGRLGNISDKTIKLDDDNVKAKAYSRDQQLVFDADAQVVKWLNRFKKGEGSFLGVSAKELPENFISLAVEVFIMIHLFEVNTGLVDNKNYAHTLALARLANVLKECESILNVYDKRFITGMMVNAFNIDSFRLS